jgi:hypothetical protein
MRIGIDEGEGAPNRIRACKRGRERKGKAIRNETCPRARTRNESRREWMSVEKRYVKERSYKYC